MTIFLIFLLLQALLIGFSIIALIEDIAVYSFSTFFFRLGIPVYRQTIDLPTAFKIAEPNKIIKKSEGQFQFTTKNQVLFMSQVFWFKIFRYKTHLPLKATGTITADNRMNIVARLNVGATLLCFTLLTAMLLVLFWFTKYSGNFLAIPIGLILFAFSAWSIRISYSIENDRLKIMISELQEIINEQNTNSYLSSDTKPVMLNWQNNITKASSAGDFPLKKPAAIAIVVIWNILIIIDFFNFYGKHNSDSPSIHGAQLAFGFVLLICLLLLTYEPVRCLILKEGRSIDDIKSTVYLFILGCISMLLMSTLIS